MLQEINKNTLGPLLPVDVISYVEALSYSSLNTRHYSVSDNETLRNTTINVSRSSLKIGWGGCVSYFMTLALKHIILCAGFG